MWEAARVIIGARLPIIYAGGGVARSDAEDALVRLAEATNIPVVTSSGGKGTIPDSHPLSYGSCFSPRGERQEMNQLFDVMQSADVVIGIGARFSLGNPAGNASTLVNINVDDGELMRIQSNTIPLHGDAKATIEAMLPYLDEARAGERPSPVEAVEAARNLIAYYDIPLKEPQYAVLEAIQASIPEDAFMVWDVTQFGVRRHLRNRPPQPRLGQVRRVVRCRRHAGGASDGAGNAAPGGARVRRARDHRRAVRRHADPARTAIRVRLSLAPDATPRRTDRILSAGNDRNMVAWDCQLLGDANTSAGAWARSRVTVRLHRRHITVRLQTLHVTER